MKHFVLLLAICSCSLSFIFAQGSPMVFSVQGKVKYAESSGTKNEILKTGTVLKERGELLLYRGSSVGIFFNDEYAYYSQEGEIGVQDLINNIDLFTENSLASMLGTSMEASMDPFFDNTRLTRSGFTTTSTTTGDEIPPTKKEKDGAGNKDFKIIRLAPTGGNVSGASILFKWRVERKFRTRTFVFNLYNAQDEVVLTQNVKGKSVTINTTSAGMETGKSYKWEVISAKDSDVKTPKIPFNYTGSSTLDKTMADLKANELYKESDAATKLLLEAIALEKANLIAQAGEKYMEASKRYKKNKLAQLMYKSFVWKYDLAALAE